jgi:hypothetical protein
MPLQTDLADLLMAADTEIEQAVDADTAADERAAELAGAKDNLAAAQAAVDAAVVTKGTEVTEAVAALRAVIAAVENKISELQNI